MSTNLKSILERGAGGARGPVKVMVALGVARAEKPLLDRLKRLGLEIDRVVGNKLIGEISADRLPSLRGDPDVSEVEESVKLRPH